jgi:predicted RNase H-like HicB family nuclease
MAMKVKTKPTELKFKVPIIVEFDSVNYHSYSPALIGLHSDGDTEEEALNNAKSTAVEFLRIMIEDGILIPVSVLTRDEDKALTKADKKGYYEEALIVNLR